MVLSPRASVVQQKHARVNLCPGRCTRSPITSSINSAPSTAPPSRSKTGILPLLHRAVEKTTHGAKQLSHIIPQAAPPTEGKKPAPVKAAEQANKVIPLFAEEHRHR